MCVPIFKFLFPKMTTVWPRIVLSKFCRHLEYCKNGRLTVIFLLSDAFVWVMFSKYNPNRTTNPNPQNPNSLYGKKIWNASRICVSSLRRGHANLLCIVPILVYVFRRIHIFGCFSNLYTTIFSPPNCFFPPHEHFFSISIPFHCKTVPSRPPMQDIVT